MPQRRGITRLSPSNELDRDPDATQHLLGLDLIRATRYVGVDSVVVCQHIRMVFSVPTPGSCIAPLHPG